ncbi:hypothetical protein PBRA_004880 [Plasmodiophora brassicae]|uniref:PCI domain-containing protein n=1 Tax=Plasmodiophora brassicae TaxID=37360 RepID=A0A0G4IM31_PLABS|nr:hypothetical protein PBRA_004880 [Plasmodiophora brassicae]
MEYAQSQATANPGQAALFTDLGNLFKNKLWHQLSQRLMGTLSDPWFDQGGRRLALYEQFVSQCSTNIDPLELVQIAIKASQQAKDVPAKIAFIRNVLEIVKTDPESQLLANLELYEGFIEKAYLLLSDLHNRAWLHLCKGDLQASKRELDAVRTTIESSREELPTLIPSRLYEVKMEYHKVAGTASEFFRSALLYLSYTPLQSIPAKTQTELSASLGLSALAAEDQYNFGELLQHPILKSLQSDPTKKWIHDMLLAFDHGAIDEFENLFKTHSPSQQVLSKNAAFLRQKIRIMNLMDMVFTRASNDRNIPFAEIAKVCKVTADEVELLLMKAMSLGVIKGVIDQVDQVVRIKHVQPRVLNTNQVEGLRTQLAGWAEKVQVAAEFVETTAPDLMTS